tara:strand:+ start:114 stop:659 length:546 start_codon:yes stop_codon:yes gene_type:complete
MSRRKYNHRRRIQGDQPGLVKAIYPGMIVQFKYLSENAYDDLPMVLCIWNDFMGRKIHGINMNYITEFNIKQIFRKVMAGGGGTHDDIKLTSADDPESEDKETLPSRNLIKEPYTRLQLPSFREKKDGAPISKGEATSQMKRIYNKVLKKYVREHDMYRSYQYTHIKSLRLIRYDVDGLLK